MKMVAMPYLHTTISKAVKDLFEEKRPCEVPTPLPFLFPPLDQCYLHLLPTFIFPRR
jgi:hypothetical protein